jgi:phosphoribosylformylglycinamidine synthase subunit PurS
MKARVYVSFKPTVLDPQGQTIQHALNGLGHKGIAAVRQGKYFEIELAPGSVQDQAGQERVAKEMDQIARDVLANPVMEDYRVEFLD